MKKVVVITGPTGVGKTDLSITLAQHFNAEIINADASQFRRGLNIGTAKITPVEMKGIKHHLIDIINPEDDFSIMDYQIRGRKLIDEIAIPFIVGGSGLYIQALITNYELSDVPPRQENEYRFLSDDELYQLLESLDKKAAERIHPHNRRRVERYLEIIKHKGKVTPVQNDYLYEALIICLTRPREVLYERINERCEKMLANGWLEECLTLKQQGIDLDKIKDIGYSDLNQYLEGKVDFETTKALIKQKTRHYAKRQMTWFRNKMNCIFVDLETNQEEPLLKTIENFLQ